MIHLSQGHIACVRTLQKNLDLLADFLERLQFAAKQSSQSLPGKNFASLGQIHATRPLSRGINLCRMRLPGQATTLCKEVRKGWQSFPSMKKQPIFPLALSFLVGLEVIRADIVVTNRGTETPTELETANLLLDTRDGVSPRVFGLRDANTHGQTFEVATPDGIQLRSIFLGYDGGLTGEATDTTITLTVDRGNDGSNELSEQFLLQTADITQGGTPGGIYWLEMDVSSNELELPAGTHSFLITVNALTGPPNSWLFTPAYTEGLDAYTQGNMTGTAQPGPNRDANFAISTVPPSEVQITSIEHHDNPVNPTITIGWTSVAGKLYDIVNTPDLSIDPDNWPVVPEAANLTATPPLNMRTFAQPAESTLFYAVVEKDPPPLFFDDFETDNGWTVGAYGGDGGNTNWERGAPGSFVSAGLPPLTGANDSVNCFGTNLNADYGANANIYLRSPAIDLMGEGLTGASLTLHQYLDTEVLNLNDIGSIRVLKASDLTQLGADVVTGLTGIPAPGGNDWNKATYDLPNAAIGQTVILEFQFNSDDIEFYSGWYLDDIIVTAN